MARDTSLSKPQRLQECNRTHTRGCAALLCVNALLAAETLTFLHTKTRKAAASLLRVNL